MAGWEFPHGDAVRGLEKCGNKTRRYPNHAYRTECNKCQAPKSMAKWELPQDPRARTCGCGAKILPNYVHRSLPSVPEPHPAPGGRRGPLQPSRRCAPASPPVGGDLHGHSAEPIMLWTEAMVNPAGPPEVSGDWPAAPNILHQVTYEPDGTALKVPYVTSDAMAEAWRVDHDKLCGKFLGHRRRSWNDNNTPPFYLWRTGYVLAVQPPGNRPHPGLVGPAHRVQRAPGRWKGTIQGLWPPVERTHACPQGTSNRERMPPFLPRWPEDWQPRIR